MSIEIKYIKDKNSNSERVVFSVNKDCNIGSYLVFLTKRTGSDSFSLNTLKHPFWFPDKEVKEKDLIILYTKPGKTSQKTNKDETISYFFYRKINEPIFKEDNDIVLLVEADSWKGA